MYHGHNDSGVTPEGLMVFATFVLAILVTLCIYKPDKTKGRP